MAGHIPHRKVVVDNELIRLKIEIFFIFFSSGRRETPFLDAKMKAQKYSEKFNTINATTVSPVSTTRGSEGSYSTLESISRTTHAPVTPGKVYESGEDTLGDTLDDDDDDEDLDEDLDEEDDEKMTDEEDEQVEEDDDKAPSKGKKRYSSEYHNKPVSGKRK